MSNENTKFDFAFTKENYVILIVGCVVVITGYMLMMGGGTDDPTIFMGDELFNFRRITLAPIVVLIGYGVLLYSIMKKPKPKA